MQNAQNTDIQRVKNLVDLYRNIVGRENEQAHKAVAEKNYWDNTNLDAAMKLHEEGMKGAIFIDMYPEIPAEKQNLFRVNEQLLGHFYSIVAGEDADIRVLQQLLPTYYDSTIFSNEDESFLKEHFKEMVNYIIETPTFDLSELGVWSMEMDVFHIPDEVLELIKNRLEIPAGSVIYNPFTCLAQFPLVYNDCTFLCEESYVNYNLQRHEDKALLLWAWMKVVIYANKIDATVIEDGMIPSSFDSVISFVPYIPHAVIDGRYDNESGVYDTRIVSKIIDSYNHLKQGGKMGLLIPSDLLQNVNGKSPLKELWVQFIEEGTIEEIIQLPFVISNPSREDFSFIIVEKGLKSSFATMIDARFATEEKRIKTAGQQIESLKYFSNVGFIEMLKNDGKDTITGLQKMIRIDHSLLKANLLAPQVYVVEKPFGEEFPVSLSMLCDFITTPIRNIKTDLPYNTSWIKESDLHYRYREIDMNSTEKADCPNNPLFIEESDDYAFWESGQFIDDMWAQIGTKKGYRVYKNRNCTYLDGNSDIVLYKHTPHKGVCVALVRALGIPFAVDKGILVFSPKDGIDADSLAAMLGLPIVYRQIQAYQKFGIENHLDDILVPTDKRIIYDEICRLKKEVYTIKELDDKFSKMRTEYINEVRMRKHDMGQYIFELINIEDLMRYYIDNRDTEKDFCHEVEMLLDNFRSSLGELSTLLDNFSKEEQFGEPENFDIDAFLSQVSNRHKADGFNIIYSRDDSSINWYNRKQFLIDAESRAREREEAMDDAMIDAEIMSQEHEEAMDDAMIDAEIMSQEHEETIYQVLTDVSSHTECLNVAVNNISDKYNRIPSLYIAKSDIQRLVNNIVDNARKHGFTDPNRNDYVLNVVLSIDSVNNMFIVDFRNNGNPLPEGMDKMRYGLKGEKAGETGGTGIGGNYVKQFVEHYGGDYDVFMDNGWTVVRICLPIKG